MSKLFFSLLVLQISSIAMACPNLSGEYTFTEHPWNGKMIVSQQGCESISIKSMDQIDPTTGKPNSNWDFTVNYKTDGRAYKGMYQSIEAALATDNTFHITTFTSDGISMIDYSGSQDKCSLSHTFNSQSGNCKKTEFRLEFNRDINQYAWRQIGEGWWPNGWTDYIFPLSKK
jgi:hypothetical protein